MKRISATAAAKDMGRVKAILTKLGKLWESVAPFVRHAGATASKFIKPDTLQKEFKRAVEALDINVQDKEVVAMIDEFQDNKGRVRGVIERLGSAFE